MTFLFFLVLFLFLGLTALLCFVILIQESKSLGLGASFGGDSGDSLFGTSTADVLKKFTAYLAAAFMIGCILLSIWTSALGKSQSTSVPTQIEETTNES